MKLDRFTKIDRDRQIGFESIFMINLENSTFYNINTKKQLTDMSSQRAK